LHKEIGLKSLKVTEWFTFEINTRKVELRHF
jgi:hypothetical protein